MKVMNENLRVDLRLRDHMASAEGWGRVTGRAVYSKVRDFVEAHPGALVFRVFVAGVKRVDLSFASETIVEVARRYRGNKGFCFLDLVDTDMRENWEAAAQRAGQPIIAWAGSHAQILGVQPSQGSSDALTFAMEHGECRVAEYAAARPSVSVPNASNKFKQLWEQGFLLRREMAADSGGVEYVYSGIK